MLAMTSVMKVGDAVLNRIEEVRIANKIEWITKDRNLIESNKYWISPHFLDDKGGFDLVFQSWIVEVGGRVVLVDPCNGNGIPHSVSYFNNLDVPYIERMQKSGYRPQDIDFVICTHLHHDHCGWNTELRNGVRVPTFPNARYILQQLEHDNLAASYRNLPAGDLNQGVFERSVDPVVQAGLVDFVSGDFRLTPEIEVQTAPGHTLGHQMVHLSSAGRHAFFTGDCFHHPIQLADPTVQFAGAEDLEQVTEMRRKLVNLACDLDAYLIGAHIPAPYTVRASRAGNGVHFAAGA